MAPRKSRRVAIEEEEERAVKMEHAIPDLATSEYIEIDPRDIDQAGESEEDVAISLSTTRSTSAEPDATGPPAGPSRRLRLLMRKTHLMSAVASLRHFCMRELQHGEMIALAVSTVPAHILRIFDPSMMADGRSVKNSVVMLATWWKNNIGLRLLPRLSDKTHVGTRGPSKSASLRMALSTKSAYEDDYVKVPRPSSQDLQQFVCSCLP